MKILVRDRIKGVNSSNVQLASYGPGNITDDSTRNVWISGATQDSLDIECESQLKALFLGNVRADSIKYSHFKSEIQPKYAFYKNEGTTVRCLFEIEGENTGEDNPIKESRLFNERKAELSNCHVEDQTLTVIHEQYDKLENKTYTLAEYECPTSIDVEFNPRVRITFDRPLEYSGNYESYGTYGNIGKNGTYNTSTIPFQWKSLNGITWQIGLPYIDIYTNAEDEEKALWEDVVANGFTGSDSRYDKSGTSFYFSYFTNYHYQGYRDWYLYARDYYTFQTAQIVDTTSVVNEMAKCHLEYKTMDFGGTLGNLNTFLLTFDTEDARNEFRGRLNEQPELPYYPDPTHSPILNLNWLGNEDGSMQSGTASVQYTAVFNSFPSYDPKQLRFIYISGDTPTSGTTLLWKEEDSVPLTNEYVKLGNLPSLEFYEYEDDVIQKDIPLATRFYRNLSDFVQGIFQDSVSIYKDIPYKINDSKFRIDFQNSTDRKLNTANYWIQDTIPTSAIEEDVSVRINGADGKLEITEPNVNSVSQGDIVEVYNIDHSDSVTGKPPWYYKYNFNGLHRVTSIETGDGTNTVYKTERVVSPWSNSDSYVSIDPITVTNLSVSVRVSRNAESRGRLGEDPKEISDIYYNNGNAEITYNIPHQLNDGDIIIVEGTGLSEIDGSQQIRYQSSYTVSFTFDGTVLPGTQNLTMYGMKSYVPINIDNFGLIKVGSHLIVTDSNGIIRNHQILSIRGNGINSGDISVRGDLLSSGITKILSPIYGGVVRAGYSIDFPNAQIGLTHTTKDYSIKKELDTGSYHFLNRITSKQFTGALKANATETDKFITFYQQQMGKPFACQVLSDMGLNVKTALYAYFGGEPTETYNNRLDNLRDVTFDLREVL